jgi:hypothetical protein
LFLGFFGKEAIMAKSERQRQLAAEKKRRKDRKRAAKRRPESFKVSVTKQLQTISTLSSQSGEIVRLLMDGLTEEQSAQQLGIATQEVSSVVKAFNRLPDGIKDVVTRWPEAFKNPKFLDGLLEASKRFKRDKLGCVDFSSSDLSHLNSLFQEGRAQIEEK